MPFTSFSDELIETIRALLREFKSSTPTNSKAWSERMEAEDENWEESRPRVCSAFKGMQGVPAKDTLESDWL